MRKTLPKLISDAEMQTIEKVAQRLPNLKYHRLDREMKALTIYAGDQPEEMYEEIVAFGIRNGAAT